MFPQNIFWKIAETYCFSKVKAHDFNFTAISDYSKCLFGHFHGKFNKKWKHLISYFMMK